MSDQVAAAVKGFKLFGKNNISTSSTIKDGPLRGATPVQVKSILGAVLLQVSGDSAGDDFWIERAEHIMLTSGTLLEAWEYTEAGRDYLKHHGNKPYSLINIYKLSVENPSRESWGCQIIQDILNDKNFNDPASFEHVKAVANDELKFAMEFFLGWWWDSAKSGSATLAGVQANIAKVLSPKVYLN